jgi:hypothetical protein
MYVPHIGTLYPVLVNTDASCDSNNLVYSQQKLGPVVPILAQQTKYEKFNANTTGEILNV